jgi:Lipid A 3-O-deacylase (PagL)
MDCRRLVDALPRNRVCECASNLWRSGGGFAANRRRDSIFCLVALCLAASHLAYSQETALPEDPQKASALVETGTGVILSHPGKLPVESDIAIMGMIPDGDYRLFSATVRCHAWTVGVEYDRHSWGRFLSARFDYVAEVIPLVLLSQPVVSDFWGNALSPNQRLVYGISLSPFGMRFLWRNHRAISPYMVGKLGAAVFTRKALSPNASYVNFNIQADAGVQIRMTDRMDLRVDPFAFFHVSDGYLAASNPGMDQLATKIGVSYHLGKMQPLRGAALFRPRRSRLPYIQGGAVLK